MNKNLNKLITFLILTPSIIFAEEVSYQPLSGESPITKNLESTGSLDELISALFEWGIVIAVILAVIMIIIGGIQYMTTDAIDDKKGGIEKVNSALGGLILAFAAWFILNTINPDILKTRLDFSTVKSDYLHDPVIADTSGETWPTPETSGSSTTPLPNDPNLLGGEQQTRDYLQLNGIGINKGPCGSPNQSGCTEVGGLRQRTYSGLVELKRELGVMDNIKLTGGSEKFPHTPGPINTHESGHKVDINFDNPTFNSNLEALVKRQNGISSVDPYRKYNVTLNNGQKVFVYKETKTTHYDLTFVD